MTGRFYLDPETVTRLGQSCVYIAFDGDEPIYVGATRSGLARPLGGYERIRSYSGSVGLLLIPVPKEALRWVEDIFIASLRPRLNRVVRAMSDVLEYDSKCTCDRIGYYHRRQCERSQLLLARRAA